MILIPTIELSSGRVAHSSESEGKAPQKTSRKDKKKRRPAQERAPGEGGEKASDAADPLQRARALRQQGAVFLNLVDLDAHQGHGDNLAVAKVLREALISFQWCAGLAQLESVEQALQAGADRVVLGPRFLEDAKAGKELAQRFAMRLMTTLETVPLAPGVQGARDLAAEHEERLARAKETGVPNVMLSCRDAQGLLLPPDVETTRKVIAASGLNVYVHAPIGCAAELEELDALTEEGLVGVVLGASSAVDLAQALAR